MSFSILHLFLFDATNVYNKIFFVCNVLFFNVPQTLKSTWTTHLYILVDSLADFNRLVMFGKNDIHNGNISLQTVNFIL